MTQLWKPLAVALLLLPHVVARADGYVSSGHRLSTLVSLTWEIGVPAGTLPSFVDATSARGGQLEVRMGVARHLSLGLATSFNWFSQNDAQKSLDFPNATVTGPVYDRVQIFTLRLTGHWYLTDGPLQPYIGAGAGGAHDDVYRFVGDLATSSSDFSATIDPQFGLLWTLGPGLALHFQVRWQYTFARFANVKNAQWVGAQVGVAVY